MCWTLYGVLYTIYLLSLLYYLLSLLQQHSEAGITVHSTEKTGALRIFAFCFGFVLSHVFPTPWTRAHQAPLSMGLPRQEYWNGLPFPTPGDLLDPGIAPVSLVCPAMADGLLPLCHLGSPQGVKWIARYPTAGKKANQRFGPGPRASKAQVPITKQHFQ